MLGLHIPFCKSLPLNLGLFQDPQNYLRKSQIIWVEDALKTPGGFWLFGDFCSIQSLAQWVAIGPVLPETIFGLARPAKPILTH